MGQARDVESLNEGPRGFGYVLEDDSRDARECVEVNVDPELAIENEGTPRLRNLESNE